MASRWPELVVQHVKASGLASLGLYVAAGPSLGGSMVSQTGDVDAPASDGSAGAPTVAVDRLVEEVVAILRVCQTAADEIQLLKDVCGRLRQHLHAAAVAFVAVRGGLTDIVASVGTRLETEIAGRAVAAGTTIPPHCHHDRVEAAAPVVYGGTPIGALCMRWTIGSTYDHARAGSVLTMSAAAAAPILAAIGARHTRGDEEAGELIGITPAMVALRQSVLRAAAAPFGVLIDGESGSGKELVARAIHRGSGRRHKPFCTVNCAALPDDLVEAELFGHARGAFTGAVGDRAGVFEEAHGGTLFLDEIGELTPRAQAKVLRVIQEGELRRVGENATRRIDVRIVSATNRALRQEVDAGRFRLDLLYRLDVVHITVPALRDRREDIPLLAEQLWRDVIERVGSRATLGAPTLAALARHDWPGNVRELQNVLAALAVRTPRRGVIPPSALPPQFGEAAAAGRWSLEEARRTFEASFVRAALVRTGGHQGRAAAELGVTRQGLTKLMSRLGIAR
jgi:DNA-binding NtrC family response regulator